MKLTSVKEEPRSRPLRSRSFLALACAAIGVTAGAFASTPTIPKLLQEVEQKYIQANPVTAEFTQVNETSATGQRKTSSGTLMAKRPDKMRWETEKPDRNLLISDGRTFWFYTPPFDEGERGQVIERKSSQVQSRLANALLSGSFSMARGMKIQVKEAGHYVLFPKRGSAGSVTQADVWVNPSEKTIEKVTILHKGGNRSEIKLTKITLGKALDDEIFRFAPPPNTDRVTQLWRAKP